MYDEKTIFFIVRGFLHGDSWTAGKVVWWFWFEQNNSFLQCVMEFQQLRAQQELCDAENF